MEQVKINRKTYETDIELDLRPFSGTGYTIDTGIPFLDHMLTHIAKHGQMDMTLRAKGDIEVDFHHTVEDVGITIGQALKKALGDRKGITRFAHSYLPMDETLSRVAIDISGRPHLEWKVHFTRDKLGEMDTELFREWFGGFAGAAVWAAIRFGVARGVCGCE